MEIIEVLNVVEAVKPFIEGTISLDLPLSLEELKNYATEPERVRKCHYVVL